uniref:hypothetical protein n=1 Tax=Okeania sp. SIO2F4 TaxID=2607790 RepID=UPI0025DFB525
MAIDRALTINSHSVIRATTFWVNTKGEKTMLRTVREIKRFYSKCPFDKAVRPRDLRVSLSETLRSRQLRDCRLTRKGALHSPSHGASGRNPARSPR